MTSPSGRASSRFREQHLASEIATLKVLCAGAAQGFVTALEAPFHAQKGARIVARFGAVGALQEALLAGEPCDVLIVTQAMLTALVDSNHLIAGSRTLLGHVRTAMAVCAGESAPDISSASALAATLRAAQGIYFPDPLRATAGRHFADVLRRLGVDEAVASVCHIFPNGATAMRALAASQGPGQLGCTQVSEILTTAGLRLIGALPPGYELVTAYAAATAQTSKQLQLAAEFLALLGSNESRLLRERCGIEIDAGGAA